MLHRTPLALSLGLLLNAGAAVAQATLPLPPLSGLTPGQWFVGSNQVSASTLIDGIESGKDAFHIAPRPTELAMDVKDGQTQGSKSATAFARVGPNSLGTAVGASDPLNPDSTFTGALAQASLLYVAVLDNPVSVRFELKLDGQLDVNGSRSLGSDRSSASLAMFAWGSQSNGTTEQQRALFANAGIDIDAEGDAMLAQLQAWPTSTQAHLATLGAQATTSSPHVTVDETLHVTAEGTRIDCDVSVAPICGRYVYYVGVSLFTLAQNGGFADFSHTLQVSSFSIDGGAAQAFAPTSPVPEPASALLMLIGGAALLARRRRAR